MTFENASYKMAFQYDIMSQKTISQRIIRSFALWAWNSLQFRTKATFLTLCFIFSLIILNILSQLTVVWNLPAVSVKRLQGASLVKIDTMEISNSRHAMGVHEQSTLSNIENKENNSPNITTKPMKNNDLILSKESLSNLTKPWFTIFPKDEYLTIEMYHSLKKRNSIVTNLPAKYSINVPFLCDEGKPSLLIMVPSVVNDGKIRNGIRNTWASRLYGQNWLQNNLARIVFVFGDSHLNSKQMAKLNNESLIFKDILTINMHDSYGNLSLKIASMMRWSNTFCKNVDYVAKVDADTLINIPLFLSLLKTIPRHNFGEAFVTGFKHAIKIPKAEHKGRWAIPSSLYPYNVLPRYVYGHSYALSRTAVERLVASIPYFPIIPNEDAFITGIMSYVSNYTRVHSPAFAHLFLRQKYTDVVYRRFVSSIHKKDNLVDIWKHYTTGKTNETLLLPKKVVKKNEKVLDSLGKIGVLTKNLPKV